MPVNVNELPPLLNVMELNDVPAVKLLAGAKLPAVPKNKRSPATGATAGFQLAPAFQLVDVLPNASILYEKFGNKPDRVDHATRRLFWSIKSIRAGEERVISYVIYNKLRVLGRYQLPSASAVYSYKGLKEHSVSNMAYFVSETVSTNEE